MIRLTLWAALMFVSVTVQAASPLYKVTVRQDFDTVYKQLNQALEQARFFVVLEPDIGKNLAGFAEVWGQDYNRNKLERIRSIVFCNGWYANRVANADPDMLALCPLHISLTHKKGATSVLFVRPDYIASKSKARYVTWELTDAVIDAIDKAIAGSRQ